MEVVAHAIEEPLTAAEERRDEADLQLVHQAGEILPGRVRSAGEGYIVTACGSPRPLWESAPGSWLKAGPPARGSGGQRSR